MKNQGITLTAILSGFALLGGAWLGGEKLLDLIPFATSSEHLVLAGEVGENTVAVRENTASDLDRVVQDKWDKIFALDLAEYKLQTESMELPPNLWEQRARIIQERKLIEMEAEDVREEIQRLGAP